MEEQQRKFAKLKEFGRECARVLRVTRKPTMKEFRVISLVSGILILIIGFIGFIITMGRQLLFK